MRKSSFKLLSLLLVLRKFCSGDLVVMPQDEGDSDNVTDDSNDGPTEEYRLALENILTECPICLDCIEDAVITICKHQFCRECLCTVIENFSNGNAPCPLCRQLVKSNELRVVVPDAPKIEEQSDHADQPTESMSEDDDDCRPILRIQTKAIRLLEAIKDVVLKDPTAKVCGHRHLCHQLS